LQGFSCARRGYKLNTDIRDRPLRTDRLDVSDEPVYDKFLTLDFDLYLNMVIWIKRVGRRKGEAVRINVSDYDAAFGFFTNIAKMQKFDASYENS